MEQWVTTSDELFAGGRYPSLTGGAAYRWPIQSSSISAVSHIPYADKSLAATHQLVTERSMHWMTYSDWAPSHFRVDLSRHRCDLINTPCVRPSATELSR